MNANDHEDDGAEAPQPPEEEEEEDDDEEIHPQVFAAAAVERGSELVRALRRRESLDVIQSIVRANPDLLRTRTEDYGWFPLSDAISAYNSPDVIWFLLQEWPESIRKTIVVDGEDDWCELPIHVACHRRKVDETEEDVETMLQTIKILVELWPESLQAPDDMGRLPLHLARHLKHFEYLLESYPPAVRERDNEGKIPLHHAVADVEGSDALAAIECLVKAWPESVQARDERDQVPLHQIEHGTPFEVVRFLVSQWPESLQEARDEGGFLPLHRALLNGYPAIPLEPTITFLINQWPEAVREPSKHGYVPLHVAIYHHHPVATIVHLVSRWPESINERSNAGYLPLHEAARRGAVVTAQFLLIQWPESIREKTFDGCTALHEAVRGHDLDMVRYLLQKWPEAVREPNHDGWLPIHVAVQYRPIVQYVREHVLQVARCLLRAFPEAVWTATTKEGYLSLHAAVTRGKDRMLHLAAERAEHAFVRFLVREAPATIRMAANDGMMPLHCAILSGICLPAVRLLIEQWPEALFSRTAQGFSALQLAVTREKPFLELVQYLAELNPPFLRDVDKDGATPVHVAVAHDQPLEIVQFLVEQRPQSLGEADRDGNLPLHVVSARSAPKVDVARYLIEQRPQSADVTNRDGSLPLHIAVSCGEGSSSDLVRCFLEHSPESVRKQDGRGWIALHLAAKMEAPLEVPFVLATKWPEAVTGECTNKDESSATMARPDFEMS